MASFFSAAASRLNLLLIAVVFLAAGCAAGAGTLLNAGEFTTGTSASDLRGDRILLSSPDEPQENPSDSGPVVHEVQGSTSSGTVPASISIPGIDVEAPVEGMGLEPDGAMAVPDTGWETSWFSGGAAPGAQGNAVIAGHVDDMNGPAVFYDLHELEAGDPIYVTGEDGTILTFAVESEAIYPYDDAPIETIFGPSDERRLNLITCTGEFDRNVGTHRERLVLTAVLVDVEASPS
ncbi:class F sortase [Alkalicoccus chagannorensis]|uniref:class F sortase n=1 Tax=Alkalicoccus chagannorensis TaxID=427072 RepID=UPI0003F79555|nr:class F sortase [Alkalicoccus chagannorensis]